MAEKSRIFTKLKNENDGCYVRSVETACGVVWFTSWGSGKYSNLGGKGSLSSGSRCPLPVVYGPLRCQYRLRLMIWPMSDYEKEFWYHHGILLRPFTSIIHIS